MVLYEKGCNHRVKKAIEKINKLIKSWNHKEQDLGIQSSLELIKSFIYPVIYAWTDGETEIIDILKKTNFQEGDLVRIFRKLLDLIFMLINCEAISISIKSKLKSAIPLINRGIVNIEEFLGSFTEKDNEK